MSERLFEVLHRASLFLEKHHKEQGVAELLLQHHLKLTRSQFFMELREPVSQKALETFEIDLRKHVETGVPIQHLIGEETFYGRSFTVNEDVLIPRPETEEVVERAIQLIQQHEKFNRNEPITIVDVGTGSGIIAITLDIEITNTNITAVDISPKALKIAKQNAKQLNTEIEFFEGSFLQPLIEKQLKVDFIISNPPYIPYADLPTLSVTVREFDPELALFADESGLYAYRNILEQAPQVLNSGGAVIFEIGHDQGESVPNLAKANFKNATIETFKDINQNDRIVTIKTAEF